jgi:hypothetical protein
MMGWWQRVLATASTPQALSAPTRLHTPADPPPPPVELTHPSSLYPQTHSHTATATRPHLSSSISTSCVTRSLLAAFITSLPGTMPVP